MKVINIKTPSYLRVLFEENEFINLAFSPKESLHDEARSGCNETCDNSIADLTGTPLKTDLLADDTIIAAVVEKPNYWSYEEGRYGPMTLQQAQDNINDLIRKEKCLKVPIFALCDGADARGTVLLGCLCDSGTFSRTLVHILPCVDENSSVMTLEQMKQEHLLKEVRGKAEVAVYVKKRYMLFGCNLKNYKSLKDVENNGSIAIETTENDHEQGGLQNKLDMKMILQVVVGHELSPIKHLWDELSQLQALITLLSQHIDDSTPIAANQLECCQIIDLITEALKQITFVRNSTRATLDLNNLRTETLLDKLWNILKVSATIEDLRNSLLFFFEELAEMQKKIQILDMNSSTIAAIVNAILEGKPGVSTVNPIQAIKFLVELGQEKLKNDYLAILKYYFPSIQATIQENWQNLKVSVAAPESQVKRSSVRHTLEQVNAQSFNLKLWYLHSMHKVIDFIYLLQENTSLSKPNFDQFCEVMCLHFLKTTNSGAGNLKNVALYEFASSLGETEGRILLTTKQPESWSVRFTSKLRHSQVTTTFNVSEYPIFPPLVYNRYNVNLEDAQILYVTKYVRYEN